MTNWEAPDHGPVTPQPFKKPALSSIWFMNYMWVRTYWAKEISDGMWQTCSYEEVATPDYVPRFIVHVPQGFAVYNERGKPIVCTDREVFKHTPEFDMERAEFTLKPKFFNENPIPGNLLGFKTGTLFDHEGNRINSGGRTAK